MALRIKKLHPRFARTGSHQEGRECGEGKGGELQSDVDGYQFPCRSQEHHTRCREQDEAVVFAPVTLQFTHVIGRRHYDKGNDNQYQKLKEQGELVYRQGIKYAHQLLRGLVVDI